ncbi:MULTISPECIES: hypothetical protein [unclassified Anaeromyxobacter]|uniref:hypothetical protein n=1 Tax=unclassified Anaeromyxobacter TaxID=2620896 RepID=UPI001F5AF6A1|nr:MULTISPECIES: hypothetical protein [unclassified Anaeromyxobacter]
MLTIPFLTDLDSRAAVRGSRDPLGIQTIWTRFGRHIVGNLTTVTNSVRDFTVLLLGYHFAERLADTGSREYTLHAFLKWEQLASYARAAVNKDLSFRGTERVQKRLSDGGKVALSADAAWAILGDQKNYGLWGLYTVPARASGLLHGDPPRLSPAALEFVESYYLPMLTESGFRRGDRIVDLLGESSPRLDPDGRDRKLLEAVARLIKPKIRAEERAFYREHLLFGGPEDATGGRQRQLVSLLGPTLGDAEFAWSPRWLRVIADEARRKGDAWHPLAHRLDRIRACESVVAPAAALFGYVQGCDRQPLAEVAARTAKVWKHGAPIDLDAVRAIRDELGAALDGSADRWVAIAEALAPGDHLAAIELVLQQNRAVMQDRGGSAWIEKVGGKLDVRFHEDEQDLPSPSELKDLWRFPYFLDALRTFEQTLREDA